MCLFLNHFKIKSFSKTGENIKSILFLEETFVSLYKDQIRSYMIKVLLTNTVHIKMTVQSNNYLYKVNYIGRCNGWFDSYNHIFSHIW